MFLGTVAACAQATDPRIAKELAAAKHDFQEDNYDSAADHYKKANKLQQGACFDCYIGLIKIGLANDDEKEALKQAEHALQVAGSDQQRATVHSLRGLVFFQMASHKKEKLSDAEAAYHAALLADAACAICKYNLARVLLRESKQEEAVEVLKSALSQFQGKPLELTIQRLIREPERGKKNFAPEFSAKLKNGEEISLEKLQGKVVLLDFWGTWCGPCRASLPGIKKLAAKMDPNKFVLVSIDEGDSEDDWSAFIAKNAMAWPQIYDEGSAIEDAFGVNSYPSYLVLDRDGIVKAKLTGWAPNREDDVKAQIESAIKAK